MDVEQHPSGGRYARRTALAAFGLAGTAILGLPFLGERKPKTGRKLTEPVTPPDVARPIRVRLTPSPLEKITIRSRGRLEITREDSGQTVSIPPSESGLEVTAESNGVQCAALPPGTGSILVTASDQRLWVGDHCYRGSVRFLPASGRRLIAINTVGLEDYLPSVVDGEMPAAFPAAAREAQAVVARTYAWFRQQAVGQAADYDLHATARSQKYLGREYFDSRGRLLTGETASAVAAVRQSAGLVATSRGTPFCTYYSAVCGGMTIRGTSEFPDAAACLAPVPCEWCSPAERFRWEVVRPREEFIARLRQSSILARVQVDDLSIAAVGNNPGLNARFALTSGRARSLVSGQDLRRALSDWNLWSPRFTIELIGDNAHIRGRGHGHGVGLCQWGAAGMAKAGHSATEILQHYYPGMELRPLDEIAQT
ncbi:MAG: SpoIID/LytB domain-containing protein [Planctomycetaceae bacterium]|nr:SpoIID/LytB domain-containing protein [Planctomycetaceae bacterium]